jgi:hypothetical protein
MSHDRSPRRARAAVLASAVALATAAPLAAQAPAAPSATQLPWLQTLAVNPLAIPLGIFSAEYEVALPTPGLTVAIGGTYTANSDIFERRERWLTARVMYYPNEVQLRGLSLGLTLGARRAQRADDDGENVRRSEGAPTLGIMAGYNWIVGSQQRLVLGGGIGAARVLKNVDSNSPLNQVYPDGRILVGIAF